jgi:MHS family proline/betaine transporter-like MFS transporter
MTTSKADTQRSLTRDQKEAVGLLSIGTFLEYFDLMLYVHMAVLLNELFFPKYDPFTNSLLTAFAFCSTYLLRPFGALLFGYIGDHVGRKSIVVITTLLMAFSCFIMAILPTYAQIGITASWLVTGCRIFQGMSSMGEFIGAQLYLTEITKPPIQYPVVALTAVFSILGGTVALGIAALTTIEGVDINWRYAFAFGSVVALVGTIARTTLKETPDFADAKKRIMSNLNNSQQQKVKKKNVWTDGSKKDKKTFFALFILDCGWPVCFYFSYIFCGDILKREFAFTASEVQFAGVIVLTILSYKIYPPKIVKAKLLLFIIVTLTSPFLITILHNSSTIFFIQCCFLVFACDYVPAMPITYKHISVLRRFTYCSMSYALSRSTMSVITSFGLVYLFKYFGYWGIIIAMTPIIIGYISSVHHFDQLEREENKPC